MGCNVIPSPAPATGLSPRRTIGGYDGISTAWKFLWTPSGKRSRVPSPAERRSTTFQVTATAGSEGIAEEDRVTRTAGSSTRSQLDLLEQLASSKTSGSGYQSDASAGGLTIREQLAELVVDGYGEFTLPLGKKLKASMKSLTISQKRNIRRQSYLNVVSTRNDSVFFATIGAFVMLPPIVILAVAVITGYVQLLP